MKFDIVKQIDDYLARVDKKPLTESQKKFFNDINESGFPELRGLSIRPDNYHRDYSPEYLMIDYYALDDMDPDFLIYDDEIKLRTDSKAKLHIAYDTTREPSIKRLCFRKGQDIIEIVRDEESNEYLLKLYVDGSRYHLENGSPDTGNPDIVCNLKKAHNTNEYSDCYYVTDPSKKITDDDKPIRIGTGDNVEYELAPQDFYSEFRAFRAIGELVSDIYHEKYLFEGKKRVLSKTKTGQVRLDG